MSESNVGTKVTGGASRGFTLVELMITVPCAILAAIAIPSYRQLHHSGPKSFAGESVMMDIANREQQYLLANRSMPTSPHSRRTVMRCPAIPAKTMLERRWRVTMSLRAPRSSRSPLRRSTDRAADVTLTLDNQAPRPHRELVALRSALS